MRLSSHANWDVPSAEDIFSQDFDPHHSLVYAFTPTWKDPLVVALSVLQLLAYGYFAHLLGMFPALSCSGVKSAFVALLPAAVAIQLFWGMKAVYLFDKASTRETGLVSIFWRTIRTALLGIPFAYIPTWVIGCFFWPFVRIGLHGGSNFYDASVVVGQYVQNSIWYVGGRQGALLENLHAFGELTIKHRSRYWDAAGEQTTLNLVALIFAYIVLMIGSPVFSETPFSGFYWLILFGACFMGFVFNIVNTTGMSALSLLEYSAKANLATAEPDLTPDDKSRWILYIPHAIAGGVIYAVFFYLAFWVSGKICS